MNRRASSRPAWVIVVTLLVFADCPFLFAQDGDKAKGTGVERPDKPARENVAPPAKGPKDRAAGRRSGSPTGLWKRMSEDERDELLCFLEKHFPTMFDELERMRERHVDRFERRMKRIAPDIRYLMETMDTHPRRAALMIRERRLDIRIRSLVSKYHSTENQAKLEELRGQIRELVQKAVECRHDRRGVEIGELEERIAELKRRNEARAKAREKIIEQELQGWLDRPKRKKASPKEDE